MRLFKPAWQSKNSKRAVKAVNKLTDQNELERAAREAMNGYARMSAIGKLTDQNVLIDIAKNDKHRDIRRAAINNLTDENIKIDSESNTIGGWVFELFEKIPEVGESISTERFKITVLSMNARRIGTLRFELICEE